MSHSSQPLGNAFWPRILAASKLIKVRTRHISDFFYKREQIHHKIWGVKCSRQQYYDSAYSVITVIITYSAILVSYCFTYALPSVNP